MKCTIEIHHHGQWHHAATFEPDDSVLKQGYRSGGRLSYDVNYAAQFMQTGISTALSCHYPVSFEIHNHNVWPAFLLDILPSGAGRRFWLQQLSLRDGATADWSLLSQGAGNPIGNLRVREANTTTNITTANQHAGFTYKDVLQRRDEFIEYAWQHGAPIAGSSGAQGDAPKFLLTQDKQSRWHGDGALADADCSKHWLVKFPKSSRNDDLSVLRNEFAYYEVARWFGIRCGGKLHYENDTLFIPRFDRITTKNNVERLGIESFTSLAGISDFAAPTSQNAYCHALASFTTQPQQELLEFVRRDVLNVALGNTDNHGRNTAILRRPDNSVLLSPLYDFAPMVLDPAGIARVARWENEEEYGQPFWDKVGDFLQTLGCQPPAIEALFNELAQKLPQLPKVMKQQGVDEALIKQLLPKINTVTTRLIDTTT